MVYAFAVLLAVVAAALMAGRDFGSFLAYLVGILVLGLALRELDKAKRLRAERRSTREQQRPLSTHSGH